MDLSQYRIRTAEEKLGAAEILLSNGFYKDAIGRSYYCIFSATRAILALDGVDYSKHAGVIAYFQKTYVKEKIFETIYSDIIGTAFVIRNLSDYDDMFVASKADAEKQIADARIFLKKVKSYIENRMG